MDASMGWPYLVCVGRARSKIGGRLTRGIKAWADNDKPLCHGIPFSLFTS